MGRFGFCREMSVGVRLQVVAMRVLGIAVIALALGVSSLTIRDVYAGDQEEANRLIVESARLYAIAGATQNLETRIEKLTEILENLHLIVDKHSGSDHAVTLVGGDEVAGLSIPGIRRERDEARAELEVRLATMPGAIYEYRAPKPFAAALYDTTGGKPFISIVTAVSEHTSEYVTVSSEGLINERWHTICWTYLGEEGEWEQAQEYQTDCSTLFPAVLGERRQLVSDTTTLEGTQLSEAWDLEIAYYDHDEVFGHLISFTGILERITDTKREQILQQYVYSRDTGIMTRILIDNDPEAGGEGDVISVLEYQELAGPASVDLVVECARNRSDVGGLEECLCGAEFFEEELEEDELARFSEIVSDDAIDNPEHGEFLASINALMPEMEAQCRSRDETDEGDGDDEDDEIENEDDTED